MIPGPHLVGLTARVMPGAVMGSPQATMLLSIKVPAPDAERIKKTRKVLADGLPAWVQQYPPHESATQAQAEHAVMRIFLELVLGIQQEMRIAVGPMPQSTLPLEISADKTAVLYLPTRKIEASELAIKWAIQVMNALLGNVQLDLSAKLAEIRRDLTPFAEKGVNPFFIVQAAHAMGIPVFRPVPNLLVLGSGQRSRWFQSLLSDATPVLSTVFAQKKHVTAALLRAAGLPGGVHHLVHSQDIALKAAESLGYPLVVKPADADRGEGVYAGLKRPEQVALAFDRASKVSPNVLVERWAPGHTHRLTVQEGQVIRVVRRTAGGVVGDGVHNAEELVARFQETPQQMRFARRLGHPPLQLDEEALSLLEEHGLSPQSILEQGHYVPLRRRDNANTGGTNEELDPGDTRSVHPDNVRLAIEAARVLRLDFAGIDLIITNIARSWLEVGGLICEVNARPQMGAGSDPLVYQRVLSSAFPEGATVPAQLQVFPADRVLQEKVLLHLLRERSDASISCPAGLWINGDKCTPGFNNSFEAAETLLQRREVKHAVCCMTPQDIHRYGLPLPRWSAVNMVSESQFSPDEGEDLKRIRPWLQAAVRSP